MVIDKNIIIFGANGKIGSFLANKFKGKNNLYLYCRNKSKVNILKKKFLNQNNIRIKIFNISSVGEINKNFKKNLNIFKKCDLFINATGDQGKIENLYNINLASLNITMFNNFVSNFCIIKNFHKSS